MERTSYKIDKFIDFAGFEREFVMCAVSTDQISYFGEKHLRLGISVQNPRDVVVNTELSKVIAKGKALKDKSCIGSIKVEWNDGMINNRVVNALLEQESEYFKMNPGKYLAGYNKDKELFLKDSKLYISKFNLD